MVQELYCWQAQSDTNGLYWKQYHPHCRGGKNPHNKVVIIWYTILVGKKLPMIITVLSWVNFFVIVKCFQLMADSSSEKVCVKRCKSFMFNTGSKVSTADLHPEVSLSWKKSSDWGLSHLPLSAWYVICVLFSTWIVLSLLLIAVYIALIT